MPRVDRELWYVIVSLQNSIVNIADIDGINVTECAMVLSELEGRNLRDMLKQFEVPILPSPPPPPPHALLPSFPFSSLSPPRSSTSPPLSPPIFHSLLPSTSLPPPHSSFTGVQTVLPRRSSQPNHVGKPLLPPPAPDDLQRAQATRRLKREVLKMFLMVYQSNYMADNPKR